ncbi:MAG: metallophosphoesterase [Boseongicola sp.]|nr:metallophosphoesterase [Boseongicola sp.]MDD9978047.1 metallophosphoesterase [Boseongicola sp.]
MSRIYAIGDIHGHLSELENAHRLIAADQAGEGGPAQIVHIGDLTDRGPDSKGVINFLMAGLERGEDWVVLKGNHDRLFTTYYRTGSVTDGRLRVGMGWLNAEMGGDVTLQSYGVAKRLLESAGKLHARAVKKVPEDHIRFLEDLPLWHRAEGMIFVHAGIRPGFPMEAQDEDDLLWIRDEFLWRTDQHEALIVHGHTPVDYPTHYSNRVNLDCGAGYGNPLVPVVFEDGHCFALTDDGRDPLA